MPNVAERAPEGWKASHPEAAPHPEDQGFEPLPDGQEVDINSRKRAWARLLAWSKSQGGPAFAARTKCIVHELNYFSGPIRRSGLSGPRLLTFASPT